MVEVLDLFVIVAKHHSHSDQRETEKQTNFKFSELHFGIVSIRRQLSAAALCNDLNISVKFLLSRSKWNKPLCSRDFPFG